MGGTIGLVRSGEAGADGGPVRYFVEFAILGVVGLSSLTEAKWVTKTIVHPLASWQRASTKLLLKC